MDHLQPYSSRPVIALATADVNGWKLKQYAIIANERTFDSAIASAALDAATQRLPVAGKLDEPGGNHGVGFQIVHFAEVAVVSPVFYWMWGSVLANVDQMRAQWQDPTSFTTGVTEVVGCVWEFQILCFETQLWKDTMLETTGLPDKNLCRYLETSLPTAKTNT